MTTQQKRLLLIVLGVLVASYLVRSVVGTMSQRAYVQQVMQQRQAAALQRQAQAAAHAADAEDAPVKPAVPPPVKAVPKSSFDGIWTGQTAIENRGTCNLRFEIREKTPGQFSGFMTLACQGRGPLAPGGRRGTAEFALNVMNPEAAVLSGALQNDAIEFHVDKVVGADTHGCAPSSVSITAFGVDRVAAQWHEEACEGGHMELRRSAR